MAVSIDAHIDVLEISVHTEEPRGIGRSRAVNDPGDASFGTELGGGRTQAGTRLGRGRRKAVGESNIQRMREEIEGWNANTLIYIG